MEITIVLATLGSIALAALPVLLDIHRQAYASMLHSSQSSLGTSLKFFHLPKLLLMMHRIVNKSLMLTIK